MAGFGNTTGSGNSTRMKIVAGRFAMEVNQDTPGATPRLINKDKPDQKTVYEVYYNEFDGFITNVARKPGDPNKKWGDQLAITVNDGQTEYVIQLPLDSDYACDFMKRFIMDDFQLGREMRLCPIESAKDNSDKFNRLLCIYRIPGDRSSLVKSVITKNNNFGMPEWERVEIGNKVYWNKTKRINWLMDFVHRKMMAFDAVTAGNNPSPFIPMSENQGASMAQTQYYNQGGQQGGQQPQHGFSNQQPSGFGHSGQNAGQGNQQQSAGFGNQQQASGGFGHSSTQPNQAGFGNSGNSNQQSGGFGGGGQQPRQTNFSPPVDDDLPF